ncbi:MAG: prepilin-type N-terminal cleavage/methylation domain-containing protein, partial [Candidatus Poribacteria bacterium]
MRSKPGFTLIEVVTIVAILGIVFLVAYPRFTDVKKLSRTTSRELVTNLRNTRSKAISTGNAHYLKLLPS